MSEIDKETTEDKGEDAKVQSKTTESLTENNSEPEGDKK